MKKSLIRSSLLLLSSLALVACSGSQTSSDASSSSNETSSSATSSEPVSGFDVSTYEQEGKLFFYFEYTGDLEIPEYCGVYLTGAFCSWATDIDGVATLTPLEGTTNMYGGYFTIDATTLTESDYGYQLTLGYTAESGSPSTGVSWSYKSVECLAGSGSSGTDNLSFTLNASNLSANLGSHSWSATPAAVSVVSDFDIQLTFAEAVPEHVTLYMFGNFRNNWVTDDLSINGMTPDADRKVWTVHIDSINQGAHEAKIVAEYADATSVTWKNTVLDDGAGGNFVLAVLKKYGGSVYNLNDEYTCSNTAFSQDDNGDVVVNWDDVLPALSDETVDFSFEVTLAAKTNASTILATGGFNSWAQYALTSSEDGLVWTSSTYTASAGMEIEYGLPLDSSWHVAIKAATTAEDGSVTYGNFKTTLLTENCVIKVAVDETACASIDTYLAAMSAEGYEEAWQNVAGTVTVEAVSTAA